MACNGVTTPSKSTPFQIGNPFRNPKKFNTPPPPLSSQTTPPPPTGNQKHEDVKLMHKPFIQHNT